MALNRETRMQQLPKMITRGRYFKIYRDLPEEERKEIEKEMEELKQDPDLKKHTNDIARVFHDIIGGEYRDDMLSGRHEVNFPIWKALIAIKTNGIEFKTRQDKIRYICGYINNYIQQMIRENKPKSKLKYYKYKGPIKQIVKNAILEVLGIDINNLDFADINKIKSFIEKNFDRYGVTFVDKKLYFENNSTVNVIIVKKEIAMEIDGTDLYNHDRYSSIMHYTAKVEDEEFVSKIKHYADNHTKIIIDAMLDGSIMKGKSKLSPRIIANFLKKNYGYECKPKDAKNIFLKIAELMVLEGSSDHRLIGLLAENKY